MSGPIPGIPGQNGTGPIRVSHWTTDLQPWRVIQERQRHDQVLFTYGEYSAFFLMWRIEDHKAGLVARCSVCYRSFGKIAEAYGQASKNKCPSCFGTTFEGGFRAVVIRPALWDATDPTYVPTRRGEVTVDDLSIETTGDITIRTGDYAGRQDGTRWQIRTPDTTSQADGFNSMYPDTGSMLARAQREDPDSVAYLIPPLNVTLMPILKAASTGVEVLDIIQGPLVI